MAEVDAGGDAHGFKLFGAIILTEDKKQATKAAAEGNSSKDAAVADATEAAKGAAALPCPRCRSKETKFCYFNNYNVNQPRHFCRACHRYWTAGGTLRNVPVGAGRRRTRPATRGGGGPYVIEYASPCSDARTAAEAWGGGLTGGLR